MNDELNRKEPTHEIVLRLLAEAKAGRRCEVSIPEALEFRRAQYGLTKAEFAAVLGIAVSHYSECLNCKRGLPVSARCRAYAIGVPAEVLLQIEGMSNTTSTEPKS